MVSYTWLSHCVKSWCFNPRVMWELIEAWKPGWNWRHVAWWWLFWAAGSMATRSFPVSCSGFKFPPLLTIGAHPPDSCRSFPGSLGPRLSLQSFTSHPAHFLLRLVCVMGKGFVEWGKLIFLFCFEWFCSETLLFPTSCWQGFERRAQIPWSNLLGAEREIVL